MTTQGRHPVRSPRELEPGTFLPGGYRVVRKIAAGGTAWVFEARHGASNRRVAIKVLNDRFRSTPEIAKRFVNEARAAMSLESPHVVRVEAVGRLSDGLPFLAMEYLDGLDLYQVLREAGWRLPVDKALYIVDQAARALEVAHARGVVHRDIKPENIFLIESPSGLLVKVVDFGLSRMPRTGSMSGLTKTGTTVGTPQYMALEQLRGEKNLDGRADVYSLGVVTYELLSGHCPFEGDDPYDVMVRAARDEAPSLSMHRPDLPDDLIAMIAHATERDRDRRCPSARAFREGIRPFWRGDARDFSLAASDPTHGVATAPSTASLPHATGIGGSLPDGGRRPVSNHAQEATGEAAPHPHGRQPVSPPPEEPSVPSPAASKTAAPGPPDARRMARRASASHRPASGRAATVVAVLLAAIVLALGLTCFIVDMVRGTPAAHVRSPS